MPAADAAAIRAQAVPPSPERVAELERTTDHDMAAFVDAVAEQLGPEGRWIHFGLTSSDVLDTALALQIRDAGALIVAGIERALAIVIRRAEEHRPLHLHRPLARRSRRADHVRVEARGLGVRARPGPIPGRAGTRRVPRRTALGNGRDYARGRPAGRARRVRAPRPRARSGVDPGDRTRPPRRAPLRARALRHVARSLATEIRHLARTEVREAKSRSGRG